jgi:hypothetical protein
MSLRVVNQKSRLRARDTIVATLPRLGEASTVEIARAARVDTNRVPGILGRVPNAVVVGGEGVNRVWRIQGKGS